MKKQISKLVIVALTGATMALNMSCKDEEPTLSVTPDIREVVFNSDGTASTTEFKLTTNQSVWNVTSDQTWLTVTIDKAEKSFVLSAVPRTQSTPPEPAIVSVRAGSVEPIRINVSQLPGTSVNITAEVLKNPGDPFEQGELVVDPNSIYCYVAKDWKTNSEGAANGNVVTKPDEGFDHLLNMCAWGDRNKRSMTDGKLFQTVQLEAGEYVFNFFVYCNELQWAVEPHVPSSTFAVVALGSDLPNTGNISSALVHISIPGGIARGANQLFSIAFSLSQSSTVSMGFLANLANAQILFHKVELWAVR